MKSSTSIVTLSILGVACLLALPLVATPPDDAHHAMTAKCVKVVDGDTLVVRCDHDEMTVELDGVDAPELGQPWGKEVRSFVRDMVRGRQLRVEVVERTDGHAVARISVDGADLSELLAARGLAWGTDHGKLEALSDKAQSTPCGLWLDPEPVPPWEFREATA
jgi:endonuclease YncB( thermonuclease family)